MTISEQRNFILTFSGRFLKLFGWLVFLSYFIISHKFYTAVFNSFDVSVIIVPIKSVLGLFLVLGGMYIQKGKNWARLMCLYICLALGIFSIYCHVKATGLPNFAAVIVYALPIIHLMRPSVKKEFELKIP